MRLGEIRRGREIGKESSHKYIWAACEGCGKERWIRLLKGIPRRRNYCLSCRNKTLSCGNKTHEHKGGRQRTEGKRWHSAGGYIMMLIAANSPYIMMADDRGHILEHRLVMAQFLGRLLGAKEVVHHINGIRNDNRTENLILFDNVAHLRFHKELKTEKGDTL